MHAFDRRGAATNMDYKNNSNVGNHNDNYPVEFRPNVTLHRAGLIVSPVEPNVDLGPLCTDCSGHTQQPPGSSNTYSRPTTKALLGTSSVQWCWSGGNDEREIFVIGSM